MDAEKNEIKILSDRIAGQIKPMRIYLFGSFANGSYNDESDYDFYLVMKDEVRDLSDISFRAYKSIRHIKKRPVDILVGTESKFERLRKLPTVENEVYNRGVLLYEESNN